MRARVCWRNRRLLRLSDSLPANDSPVYRHDPGQGVADDDGKSDEEDGEALDCQSDRDGRGGEESDGGELAEEGSGEGVVGFRRVAGEEGEEEGEEGKARGRCRIDEGTDVEEEGLSVERNQLRTGKEEVEDAPWGIALPSQ